MNHISVTRIIIAYNLVGHIVVGGVGGGVELNKKN